MIKALLVNIATGIDHDATIDYAVSLARTFDAHLAGVALSGLGGSLLPIVVAAGLVGAELAAT